MKLKKIGAMLLAAATILSMLSACGPKNSKSNSSTENTSTAATESSATTSTEQAMEHVTLKVLYPGDASKRMDDFLNKEFANKLKDDLNTSVEVMWSPWDQYWNKKDLMIAAGEQIDWYWDGQGNVGKVVASKGARPLDDLLDKYGQDIKRVIPQENLDVNKFNGKIMAIPLQYGPTAEKFQSVLVRTDILMEVGMSTITSIADLEKFASLALNKHPDMKVCADSPVSYFLRETFSYPYSTDGEDGNIFAINEDTKKVSPMVMTYGFKKAIAKTKEWSDKGYIPEDTTVKWGEAGSRFSSGQYLLMTGAISRPLEGINDLRKNVPNATLEEFLLAPEKAKYRTFASTEAWIISPTSKYPERAMVMLNWILKNQDNYLFTIYGVKEKDYTIENNSIKVINQDSLWYEWMFRNVNYMMFPNTVTPEFVSSFKNWDNGAKLSCRFGYTFNQEPVKSQMALLTKIVDEKVRPLTTGYLDYEEDLNNVQKALTSAGIDNAVTEYQKQLDAYIANKK